MDDKDLAAFARESANAGLDLYELLGVDTSTSRDDIHRAWRRQGLKYHPDKAGANYDAALYERFERARDVLVNDAARKVYDATRAAAAQKRLQAEQMGAERRRFKDELEAAERAGGTTSGEAPFATTTAAAPLSSEREKLREAAQRRAEERQRREQEAQDRLRQKEDDRIAEIEKRLREKEDKAQWRQLLDTTRKTTPRGPVEKQPLYAYTMDRLRAAGEAQRRRRAEATGTTAVPAFEPKWEEVDDPAVHKYIGRVPLFGGSSGGTSAPDVTMT